MLIRTRGVRLTNCGSPLFAAYSTGSLRSAVPVGFWKGPVASVAFNDTKSNGEADS